jgi:hypothetical protein
MKYLIVLIALIVLSSSCSRDSDCGCVTPPFTETNWKVIRVNGGITGTDQPLNDEQKNNRLTIQNNGSYTCKNVVTGKTITGSFTMANFTSIYGDRQRFIFSPQLPILTQDYIILIENPNGKMVFGDNVHDGYLTTLDLIP